MVAKTKAKKREKITGQRPGDNHKPKTTARKPKTTSGRRNKRKRRFFLLAAWDAIITYLRDTRMELSKVKWPTREEWMRLTGVVLLVTGVSAVFLGLINYIFTEAFSLLLRLFT